MHVDEPCPAIHLLPYNLFNTDGKHVAQCIAALQSRFRNILKSRWALGNVMLSKNRSTAFSETIRDVRFFHLVDRTDQMTAPTVCTIIDVDFPLVWVRL